VWGDVVCLFLSLSLPLPLSSPAQPNPPTHKPPSLATLNLYTILATIHKFTFPFPTLQIYDTVPEDLVFDDFFGTDFPRGQRRIRGIGKVRCEMIFEDLGLNMNMNQALDYRLPDSF
jgi:hypothetical protein